MRTMPLQSILDLDGSYSSYLAVFPWLQFRGSRAASSNDKAACQVQVLQQKIDASVKPKRSIRYKSTFYTFFHCFIHSDEYLLCISAFLFMLYIHTYTPLLLTIMFTSGYFPKTRWPKRSSLLKLNNEYSTCPCLSSLYSAIHNHQVVDLSVLEPRVIWVVVPLWCAGNCVGRLLGVRGQWISIWQTRAIVIAHLYIAWDGNLVSEDPDLSTRGHDRVIVISTLLKRY